MAEQNITTKFQVDISQLKAGIQEANRNIKLANSEFKAVASSMDNWRDSIEGVTAKTKQLNSVRDAEQKKLENLQKQYEQVAREQGENSKGAQDLMVKINNQQASVNRVTKELGGYEERLDLLKTAQKNAEKSGRSLTDELSDLEKGLEDVGETAEESSDGFTVMKGAMASLIADGIKSFVSSIATAIAETKEFRSELAMLQTTAETTGGSFDKAKENLKEIASITGDTGAGVEAVNNLMSAGFKTDNLDAITDALLGASIQWKDTLKMEGLADGLQETLATMNATGSFGELLERGGKNLDEFNEGLAKCKTEAEKQNYVLQQLNDMGLTKVLENYKENNKWMLMNEQASFDLQTAMSGFATKVEPLIASVKSGVSGLAMAFLEMGTGINFEGIANMISNGFKNIKAVMNGEMSVGELMTIASTWISNLGNGISSNIPMLIQKGLDLLVNLTTSLRENAPKLIQSGLSFIQNIVKGLMDSLPQLISKVPLIVSNIANVINDNAPTILKSAVNIILTIIKGIIQAIPTLVANVPKIISAIVDVWSAFNWLNLGKTAITKMGDGIKSLGSWMKGIGTNVKDWIVNAIKNLPQTLKNLGSNGMKNLGNGISSLKSTVAGKTKEIYNTVVNGVKNLPSKMKSVGSDLVKGLWNGISNMTGWVIDKIQGFGSNVLDGIKDFFDIHSPSRKTEDEVGVPFVQGIVKGVRNKTATAVKQMKSLGAELLDGANDGLSGEITTLKGNLSGAVNRHRTVTVPQGVTNNNVTYNQTINSPKSLSRAEIYRDTKNLIILANGGV